MIARLLISPSLEARIDAIEKELEKYNLARNHPDLLYFKQGEKLGIAEARQIKEHFSLKPFDKRKVVIMEDAGVLTPEAQNALLKTLEEPPKEAILILGADSDVYLLPTIISRCEIVSLAKTNNDTPAYHTKYAEDLNKLLISSIEERFEYVEKLKSREEFLLFLVYIFRRMLMDKEITIRSTIVEHNVTKEKIKNYLKELLQAEEWTKQNVNIRAILEYLMLVMPSKL